jgi:hypothetical protein
MVAHKHAKGESLSNTLEELKTENFKPKGNESSKK